MPVLFPKLAVEVGSGPTLNPLRCEDRGYTVLGVTPLPDAGRG
jgi:hypothetical protein